MKENLFNKYGGMAIVAAIKGVHDEVLETSELSHFFKGVRYGALDRTSSKFLSHVEGSVNYQGRSLRLHIMD